MSAGILEQLAARVADLERQVAELKSAPAPIAPTDDDLISVAQAAKLRDCSVAAVHKAIQRGRIPCVRIGRAVRVRRRDADVGGR